MPSLIIEETEQGTTKPLRWQKGHVLGRGGFGCVYMGLNQENGELFAVKQLELDDIEDAKSRAVISPLLLRLYHFVNLPPCRW